MSKGYCNYSCKYFKFTNVYEIFEDRDSDGKVIMRWREYKGKKYYCDKYNDRFQEFTKKYEHKTSEWIIENVSMDCYEPNDRQRLLDSMKADLEQLLINTSNK